MKKKSVLVTGIGQANYILQLYENIAPPLDKFNFSSINLKDFGNLNVQERANKIFKDNYQFKYPYVGLISALLTMPYLWGSSYFWRDQRILFAEQGFFKYLKGFYNLTQQHLRARNYARFIDEHTETDIIHFHFVKHKHGLFINYLKNNYEIICTYWGSDIYRINGWKDHAFQNEVLPKVNIITAATPEIQFAIQSRFGFGLSGKIRTARFIHEKKFYKTVDDLLRNNVRNWHIDFRMNLGIPEKKIVIMFGHNASEENNHINFLKILSEIPEGIIQKFHIVFPLTYGKPGKHYINDIKNRSSNINTSFTFLEEFMEWEKLAKIKIITDVYIHAPTTDGLSAFLTEFLYTNNLAIVGSWLPFKTFINNGIEYLEFKDFIELKTILETLENYLSAYKTKINSNQNLITQNFAISKIRKEWLDIFKEFEK